MIGYKRKGEWLETNAGLAELQIPEKLLRRLNHEQAVLATEKRLRIKLFSHEDYGFKPEWMPIEVLYEDDFCLVVNKPAGIPVHPVEKDGGNSLANGIAAYYESTGQLVKVRHIHRLDADTTGAILYAKNELAQAKLDEQMRLKHIQRKYTAVVQGKVHPRKRTIDAPIGRDRHHANRRRISPTGASAVTCYEVKQYFANPQASMLTVELMTGRTHQVRVHLSSIGYPLFGDILYGGKKHAALNRQALHSSELSFYHPLTNLLTQIEAPLPEDILALIATLS